MTESLAVNQRGAVMGTGGLNSYGLWARIFAETDGDENKTKARYIKERVDEISRLRIANTRATSTQTPITDSTYKTDKHSQAEAPSSKINQQNPGQKTQKQRHPDILLPKSTPSQTEKFNQEDGSSWTGAVYLFFFAVIVIIIGWFFSK